MFCHRTRYVNPYHIVRLVGRETDNYTASPGSDHRTLRGGASSRRRRCGQLQERGDRTQDVQENKLVPDRDLREEELENLLGAGRGVTRRSAVVIEFRAAQAFHDK